MVAYFQGLVLRIQVQNSTQVKTSFKVPGAFYTANQSNKARSPPYPKHKRAAAAETTRRYRQVNRGRRPQQPAALIAALISAQQPEADRKRGAGVADQERRAGAREKGGRHTGAGRQPWHRHGIRERELDGCRDGQKSTVLFHCLCEV